jgi:hypothetical protein
MTSSHWASGGAAQLTDTVEALSGPFDRLIAPRMMMACPSNSLIFSRTTVPGQTVRFHCPALGGAGAHARHGIPPSLRRPRRDRPASPSWSRDASRRARRSDRDIGTSITSSSEPGSGALIPDEEYRHRDCFRARAFHPTHRRSAASRTRIAGDSRPNLPHTRIIQFRWRYQQAPAPFGGGLVKEAWFRRYESGQQPASFDQVVQSWDTANKPTEAQRLLGAPLGVR